MTECRHVWASNTGADFGGYCPSAVLGLRHYCVQCGLDYADYECEAAADSAQNPSK